MENFYFWIYNIQMHVDLFFDHYFNFLSVKTGINNSNNKKKNRLKLKNLEGLESLETQKYGTWLARWLNYFKIDLIWTIFQKFLKLHSHIQYFAVFDKFPWFPSFQFWLKAKTWKWRKISIFKFKYMWIYFLIIILTFWVLKLK